MEEFDKNLEYLYSFGTTNNGKKVSKSNITDFLYYFNKMYPYYYTIFDRKGKDEKGSYIECSTRDSGRVYDDDVVNFLESFKNVEVVNYYHRNTTNKDPVGSGFYVR